MKVYAVTMTAREQAELLPEEPPLPLGTNDVRGRTLATLVSPGTEIAWNYLGKGGQFPSGCGYAAVFEAKEIGSSVKGIEPGTRLFAMGGHRNLQQHDAAHVVPVPDELSAETAVICRLMGVTMTTLMTTAARPGDLVLVTGLGPVGYLCAHLFRNSGYEVCGVDPNAERRAMAAKSGINSVFASVPLENAEFQGKVALAVECSGHEQAAVDGARVVRKRGEVVLVGVPWERRTEIAAHELLHAVFHKYAVLRSGWEWEIPHHASDFRPHSIYGNFRLALRWLAEGRIPLEGLVVRHQPQNAQEVYQGLLHGTAQGLFQVFDWTQFQNEG